MESDCWLQTGKNCACFNVRKAARVITQIFEHWLQPTGLKATQFTLLTALRILGEVKIKTLTEQLIIDRTTLTRNLSTLKKKGWIKIQPGSDRRVRLVQLTISGKALLEQAYPLWEKAQKDVSQQLGKSDWTTLLESLKIASNLKT